MALLLSFNAQAAATVFSVFDSRFRDPPVLFQVEGMVCTGFDGGILGIAVLRPVSRSALPRGTRPHDRLDALVAVLRRHEDGEAPYSGGKGPSHSSHRQRGPRGFRSSSRDVLIVVIRRIEIEMLRHQEVGSTRSKRVFGLNPPHFALLDHDSTHFMRDTCVTFGSPLRAARSRFRGLSQEPAHPEDPRSRVYRP